MKFTHYILLASLTLLFLGGCGSELNTHAYKLQNAEGDSAIVNSVLEELWQKNGVVSYSTIRDACAVVNTTNSGHSKIKRLLSEAQDPDKITGTQLEGTANGFRVPGMKK